MKWVEPRLTLRIYLAGLAQFAAVALGFVLLTWVNLARNEAQEREARIAVAQVVDHLDDADALRRELERIEKELDATVVVYDETGNVLATNRRGADPMRGVPPIFPGARLPPPPPPMRMPILPELFVRWLGRGPGLPGAPNSFGPPPGGPPMPGFMVPLVLPNGHEGLAFYVVNHRGSSVSGYVYLALLLASVGIVALVTARSLSRPLAKLSRAAERLGAGDLTARARLPRSDEIGQVARAFDDMADRLASLVRSEKELLANVSHELRTPLARIRVALDLAAEGDAEVARQSLSEIAEDLAELERLISDVLAAARLDLSEGATSSESGVPPLHRESIVVSDLIEHAASRFRAAHVDTPLSVELPPHLPNIDGDWVLLRRAIDNLLDNAHKYARQPGAGVGIESSVQSGELWIAIRDRGIGIAPEDLPKVFRPFFRVDQSRARKTGGLGLGLALVKRIAVAHGGDVDIESHLGEGTCVRLRFPLAPTHASQIQT